MAQSYTGIPRGVIRNREYGTQVRDYSGLRFGNITPTDIDGLIEYRNQAYVIIETKFASAPLPFGQRLALERLSDDLAKVKPNIVVVCSHHNEADIDVANAVVSEFRWKARWNVPETETTAGDLVHRFVKWVDCEWQAG